MRTIPRGRREEKGKTALEMGGPREKRRRECRNRRKLEGKSARQKIRRKNISDGDYKTVATPSPPKEGCTTTKKKKTVIVRAHHTHNERVLGVGPQSHHRVVQLGARVDDVSVHHQVVARDAAERHLRGAPLYAQLVAAAHHHLRPARRVRACEVTHVGPVQQVCVPVYL